MDSFSVPWKMQGLWGRIGPVSMSGVSMMKRKKKFEKCIVLFPDRAQFYEEKIAELESSLRAIQACLRCGRPLRGEDSQERGYGPECAKREEIK